MYTHTHLCKLQLKSGIAQGVRFLLNLPGGHNISADPWKRLYPIHSAAKKESSCALKSKVGTMVETTTSKLMIGMLLHCAYSIKPHMHYCL